MLEGKGVEVFLPVFETMRQWKDRKKGIQMPLFPCYLFVRATPTAGRLPVLTTPGVNLIIARGDQCAVISDDEISAIRQAARDPKRIEPHPYLKLGERVRVVRGAMSGVEGILVRTKAQCRLVVSVDLLNQSAAIEVNEDDVEPALPLRIQSGTSPRSHYSVA
jgi:transcription antitermination factor NusG